MLTWREEDGWSSGKAIHLGTVNCGPIEIANFLDIGYIHDHENNWEHWIALPVIPELGQVSFASEVPFDSNGYRRLCDIYVNHDVSSEKASRVILDLLSPLAMKFVYQEPDIQIRETPV